MAYGLELMGYGLFSISNGRARHARFMALLRFLNKETALNPLTDLGIKRMIVKSEES